jgi:hypothetical protein
MRTKKTKRGFRIYSDFKDFYGERVRIQESSLATKRAVWIFGGGHIAGIHLDRARAKRLIRALKLFVRVS